jgi:hypothetical protein
VDRLKEVGATGQAHEAQVYWTRHLAHGDPDGHRMDTWMSLKELPPHMRALGHVAMATSSAFGSEQMWELADTGVKQSWQQYPTRIRVEIVKDMAHAGRYDQAADLATKVADPENVTSVYQKNAAREVLIDVLRRQAASDPYGAPRTLERIEHHTEQKLHDLAATQRQQGNERGVWEQAEAHLTLNGIAAIRTGLLVPRGREQALAAVRQFTPHGGEPEISTDEFLGAVAPAFARAGHTADAVSLVQEINHSPLTRDVQSYAFTDVARAIRTRRLAEAEQK